MGNGWSTGVDHGAGISKKELDRMQRRFQRLARGTNHVAIGDFERIPDLQNKSNPFTRRIFEVFDTNQDGFLEMEEFTAAVMELSSMTTVGERINFLFRLYDVDQDGYVSSEDLFTVLKTLKGLTLSDAHLEKLFGRQ
eukprot:jgi/Botrbrau1/16967/Bobra.49_2s0029.1